MIEDAKNEILIRYKKDRLIPLRLHTFQIVVNNLLKCVTESYYKLDIRKIIISSILYQMSSDQYIECRINRSEYNSLNVMISDNLDDIEDDIYEEYYKSSFCYKYFRYNLECC